MKKLTSILVIVLMIVGLFLVFYLNSNSSVSENQGSLSLIVLDIDGDLIASANVQYNPGDTFISILERSNMGFVFSEPSTFGVSILEIYGISLGKSEYWRHSRNNIVSTYGVSSQEFSDGDEFKFQVIDWTD